MMGFSQINGQTVGGNPIYGHPGSQIPKVWPQMMPNIGIMQITFQFGSLDNAKYPQK